MPPAAEMKEETPRRRTLSQDRRHSAMPSPALPGPHPCGAKRAVVAPAKLDPRANGLLGWSESSPRDFQPVTGPDSDISGHAGPCALPTHHDFSIQNALSIPTPPPPAPPNLQPHTAPSPPQVSLQPGTRLQLCRRFMETHAFGELDAQRSHETCQPRGRRRQSGPWGRVAWLRDPASRGSQPRSHLFISCF